MDLEASAAVSRHMPAASIRADQLLSICSQRDWCSIQEIAVKRGKKMEFLVLEMPLDLTSFKEMYASACPCLMYSFRL